MNRDKLSINNEKRVLITGRKMERKMTRNGMERPKLVLDPIPPETSIMLM